MVEGTEKARDFLPRAEAHCGEMNGRMEANVQLKNGLPVPLPADVPSLY